MGVIMTYSKDICCDKRMKTNDLDLHNDNYNTINSN